ncbi:MAG: SDR family NAD(P)-dependent oxidoreductase, partial [Planctomycetota bacterium]
MELKDKTVIVTGSGSGIGRALAVAFAGAGSTVVVCGRRKKRLDMTVQMIEAEGAEGLAVEADVTRADDVKRLVETVMKQCGPIDVLFNNAGSFRSIAGVFEVDPELWWQDVTVNLLGPLLTMRMVLPHMMKRDQGIII